MCSDSRSSLLSLEIILKEIAEVTLQIQRCQPLETLLQWVIDDTRRLLQTDRVLIYRLLPDQDAVVAFESVGRDWTPILGHLICDPCFDATWIGRYQQGQTTSISDIHSGTIAPCYVQFLEGLQVKANLVVSILNQGSLWGLLIAHHCRSPREWQPLEVQLLQHIALQLGIAVQQTELRQQQQALEEQLERLTGSQRIGLIHSCPEIRDGKQTEQALCFQEALLRSMTHASPFGFYMVDHRTDQILYLNHQFCQIWGIEHLESDIRAGTLNNRELMPAWLPLIINLDGFMAAYKPLQDGTAVTAIADEIVLTDGRTIRWFSKQVRDAQDYDLGRLYVFEDVTQHKRRDELIQNVAQGVSAKPGALFFHTLVKCLIELLDMDHVFVGELIPPENDRIRIIAGCSHDQSLDAVEYPLIGSPCEQVVKQGFCLYPDRIQQRFPEDVALKTLGGEGYAGISLKSSVGTVMGLMGVISDQAIANVQIIQEILMIFAVRAASELERQQSEALLRRYERIISATPDCVSLLDRNYLYQVVNQTYLTWNQKFRADIVGHSVSDLLGQEFFETCAKPSLDRCFAGESQQVVEAWLNYPDGQRRFARATYAPYLEPGGTISGVVINVHDLTAFKQTEEALQQKTTELDVYFSAALDLLCIANTEGYFLRLNPAWENVLGYSLEELQGHRFLDFVHPADRAATLAAVAALSDAQEVHNFINRYRAKDGSYRWLEWRSSPRGKIIYAVARDISARKATEEALRISEEKRRLALDLTQLGNWDWNLLTGELVWSEQTYALFGYAPDDPSYTRWRDRLPSQDLEVLEAAIVQSQEQRAYFNCEYRIIHPDGSIHWILVRGQTLYDEADRPVRMIGIVMDISDHKHLEIALRNSEVRYRQIVETATEGIWIIDASNATTFVNPRMEDMLGYRISEMMGKSLFDFMDEEGKAIAARLIERRRQGIVEQHDFKFQHKDGSAVWTLISTHPLLDEAGHYAGALGMLADITERKLSEFALQQQTERETALNRVFQAIRHSLDLDIIFATATTETAQLLQVERVQIAQYLPDRLCWRIVESSHLVGLSDTVGLEIPASNNPISDQLKRGELVRIENTDSLTDKVSQDVAQVLPGAWLLLPLMHQGTVWGSLTVHSTQRPFVWSDAQVSLVQAVADQLAIAIQQANLYRQTQIELGERQRAEVALQQLNRKLEQRVKERTEALQHQAEQERLLRLVTQRIHESFNLEEILETTLMATRQTLQADRVAIYRFNPDWSGNFFAESVDTGWVPLVGPNIQKIWEDTHLQQTKGGRYQNNETFAVNDIYTVGHRQCHIDLLEQFQAKAYAIAPIFIHDALWGLLAAYQNTVPRHWQAEEVELLRQIAIQMAIAIQQSTLYQTSQSQVKELKRLNQVKDDFLSTVSHELRSPMSSIKMATQMLEISLTPLGVLDDDSNVIHRYVKILREEGNREINLINDLLDLARLDAATEPLNLTPINLQFYILHLVETFSERTSQHQQQLVIQIPVNLPDYTTDLSYLERILTELLHNACKYTPAGETITVSAQATAAALEIRVTNTGVEIPEAERDHIFDKFYRIPNNDPWKHGGTGLGLALVKKLTECLGGHLHVTSGGGQTTFVLTFGYGSTAAATSHP